MDQSDTDPFDDGPPIKIARDEQPALLAVILGFVDACSAHPVLVVGFFALLLGLVATLWAEMLRLRPGPLRSPGRHAPEGPARTRS